MEKKNYSAAGFGLNQSKLIHIEVKLMNQKSRNNCVDLASYCSGPEHIQTACIDLISLQNNKYKT